MSTKLDIQQNRRSRPLDIAQSGVNPKQKASSLLRDLLDSLEGDAPLSLFERATVEEGSLVTGLMADLGRGNGSNNQVDISLIPELEPLEYTKFVVSIGGSDTGLPLHKHDAAWLAVVAGGTKRWFLLPPGAIADEATYLATSLQSPARWPVGHRDRLRREAGLLECSQKPGKPTCVFAFARARVCVCVCVCVCV
jgi:hypothetical protein